MWVCDWVICVVMWLRLMRWLLHGIVPRAPGGWAGPAGHLASGEGRGGFRPGAGLRGCGAPVHAVRYAPTSTPHPPPWPTDAPINHLLMHFFYGWVIFIFLFARALNYYLSWLAFYTVYFSKFKLIHTLTYYWIWIINLFYLAIIFQWHDYVVYFIDYHKALLIACFWMCWATGRSIWKMCILVDG